MNVLLLDNTDDTLNKTLREFRKVTVITGTIRRPKLDPLPDLAIVNFDVIFGSNKREQNLIAMADKLHTKEIVIVATSTKWNDGLKKFAKLFGADEFCKPDDVAIIRTIIHIIAATNRSREIHTSH